LRGAAGELSQRGEPAGVHAGECAAEGEGGPGERGGRRGGERAALAGLYSGLLGARELAEALKMPLEQLGRVLKSAREQLERAGIELDEPNVEKAL